MPGLSRFFSGLPWAAFAFSCFFFLGLVLAFGGPWLYDLAPLAPSSASLPGRVIAATVAFALWLLGMIGAWRLTRES